MILAPTLSLSAGSGAALVRPTFSRDFAGEKTLNNGAGPAITFTRASDATYFDADGVLRFAPNNHIRNSEALGATNGVIGSGGALPTYWAASGHNTNGISTEIIGTGTEDGFAYVDIKLSGTPTASSNAFLNPENVSQVVAANGQSWTHSCFVKLQGGTTTNVNAFAMRIFGRDSGGISVAGQTSTDNFTPTSAALKQQRYSTSFTMTDATIARVSAQIQIGYTNAQAIDLTLRIAAPQLERGPAATAYNPTTGTAYFGPRFDHDPATGASRGLLIEEARTNSIRNSQAGGSTNGVIGSGGVMPTNWGSGAGASSNGISSEIIGTGVENGLGYIDIKVSGTPTATSSANFFTDATNQIAASSGQTWSGSAYVKLQSGSLTNATVVVILETRDSSNVFVADGTSRTITPTNAALNTQRVTMSDTLSNASVAFVNLFVRASYTNGDPIDLTLRIAAPQLEQGAFATSYIPTTTAAATRAADSAFVTPISSFYNQSEGTLFAEASRYQVSSGGQLFGFRESDASLVSLVYGIATPTQMRLDVSNTTTQAQLISSTSAVANTVYRHAGAYAVDNFDYYINGTRTGTGDQSGTVPSNLSVMAIGQGRNATSGSFGFSNGHIRKIAYWPKRLTNTLLEQLTT
jgi:hypothetical protein